MSERTGKGERLPGKHPLTCEREGCEGQKFYCDFPFCIDCHREWIAAFAMLVYYDDAAGHYRTRPLPPKEAHTESS